MNTKKTNIEFGECDSIQSSSICSSPRNNNNQISLRVNSRLQNLNKQIAKNNHKKKEKQPKSSMKKRGRKPN